MNSKPNQEGHWSEGDLLLKLYVLAPEDGASDAHLSSCHECSVRWEALRAARAEVLLESTGQLISEPRLLAQRKAVWARIDHPGKFLFSKWAPVAATAMMLVTGLVLLNPGSAQWAGRQSGPQTSSGSTAQISDAQLFSDLSTRAASSTPQAVEPIRGLFESSSSKEEGSF